MIKIFFSYIFVFITGYFFGYMRKEKTKNISNKWNVSKKINITDDNIIDFKKAKEKSDIKKIAEDELKNM